MAKFSKYAVLFLTASRPVWCLNAQIVPDRYIVSLERGVADPDVASHFSWLSDVHERSVRRRDLIGLQRQFRIGAFDSYVGEFDAATVEEIRAREDVLSVEPDILVTDAFDILVTQDDADWSLASLSSPEPFPDEAPRPYTYDDSAGTGTFAYLVDSGVLVSHNDFGGRAVDGFTADLTGSFFDEYDHGTHTGGTIASSTYGIAKNSTLINVKIAFEGGSTSVSAFLQGFEWTLNNITNTPGRAELSVISMSVGFPTNQAIENAIQAAYEAGVVSVASAGNSNNEASRQSPASAPNALTVAATTYNRTRTVFSSFGASVDLFAPGQNVLSLNSTQDGRERKSGTSMSCPHVAGLVLYLKALEGLKTPDEVITRIKELAIKDQVTDPRGSPNLYAFNGATTYV